MTTVFFEVLRYILTLLFGVFVSASFLSIPFRQKSLWTLLLFSAATLSLQGLLYVTWDITRVTAFYPLVTHLPLFLLFFCVYLQPYVFCPFYLIYFFSVLFSLILFLTCPLYS